MSEADDEIKFTDAKEYNTEARLRSIHNTRDACRKMRVAMSDPRNKANHTDDQLLTTYFEAVRTYIFEIEPYVKKVDGQLPESLWHDQSFGRVTFEMPNKVRRLQKQLKASADDVRVLANNSFTISGFREFVNAQSPVMVEWTLDRVSGMGHEKRVINHAHGMPYEISDLGYRRANQFLFTMGVDMEISYRDWTPPEDYEGI